jgi:hypothetical protein
VGDLGVDLLAEQRPSVLRTAREYPGHQREDARPDQTVQDGLVWREVEPTTPPQVSYGLTEFGRDVGEPLAELFNRITQRLSLRDAG